MAVAGMGRWQRVAYIVLVHNGTTTVDEVIRTAGRRVTQSSREAVRRALWAIHDMGICSLTRESTGRATTRLVARLIA